MKSTIEVGDLVRRIQRLRQGRADPKVYLVASVSPDDNWCVLHDDKGRLTALQSLLVIRKGRE